MSERGGAAFKNKRKASRAFTSSVQHRPSTRSVSSTASHDVAAPACAMLKTATVEIQPPDLPAHSPSAQRQRWSDIHDETKHADASTDGASALAGSVSSIYTKWGGLLAIIAAADDFQTLRSSDSSIDALLCKLDQLDLAFSSHGIPAQDLVLDMALCARVAEVMTSLAWTCEEMNRLNSPLLDGLWKLCTGRDPDGVTPFRSSLQSNPLACLLRLLYPKPYVDTLVCLKALGGQRPSSIFWEVLKTPDGAKILAQTAVDSMRRKAPFVVTAAAADAIPEHGACVEDARSINRMRTLAASLGCCEVLAVINNLSATITPEHFDEVTLAAGTNGHLDAMRTMRPHGTLRNHIARDLAIMSARQGRQEMLEFMFAEIGAADFPALAAAVDAVRARKVSVVRWLLTRFDLSTDDRFDMVFAALKSWPDCDLDMLFEVPDPLRLQAGGAHGQMFVEINDAAFRSANEHFFRLVIKAGLPASFFVERALTHSTCDGEVSCAEFLVSHGAKPQHKDYMPLYAAVASGCRPMWDLLMSALASKDPQAHARFQTMDREGLELSTRTRAGAAAAEASETVGLRHLYAPMLLANDVSDERKSQLLMIAVQNGQARLARQLLASGAVFPVVTNPPLCFIDDVSTLIGVLGSPSLQVSRAELVRMLRGYLAAEAPEAGMCALFLLTLLRTEERSVCAEFPVEFQRYIMRAIARGDELIEPLLTDIARAQPAPNAQPTLLFAAALYAAAVANRLECCISILDIMREFSVKCASLDAVYHAFMLEAQAAVSGADLLWLVRIMLEHLPQFLPLTLSTSLALAAECGNVPMVSMLIAAGADVQQRENVAIKTAAEKGHHEVVSVLLARGAYAYVGAEPVPMEATASAAGAHTAVQRAPVSDQKAPASH